MFICNNVKFIFILTILCAIEFYNKNIIVITLKLDCITGYRCGKSEDGGLVKETFALCLIFTNLCKFVKTIKH